MSIRFKVPACFSKDNRCNEVAADDEEYIYAYKATAEDSKTCMKKNNQHDGQRSQAVYFSPISHEKCPTRVGSIAFLA